MGANINSRHHPKEESYKRMADTIYPVKDILEVILLEKDINPERLGDDGQEVIQVLNGKVVTQCVAAAMQRALGISADFWLALEYQDHINNAESK